MANGVISPHVFAPAQLNSRLSNNSAQLFLLGLPPHRDVGYITQDAYLPVFLWNGSDNDAVLNSIAGNSDADGISWGVSPPVIVATRQSVLVVITIGALGPLEFAAELVFSSTCNVIALSLTGTRAPQLSGDIGYLFFPHNWAAGFDESLAWKTDVLIAHNRTEQRFKLRTLPRRTFDLRLLVSGPGRRKLETWLGLRRTRYLFSPVWRDAEILSFDIPAGDTVIGIDPAHLDYAIDRWVAVFDSWNKYEIRTVTGIGSHFISIDSPFERSWPAGSTIAPCRYGRAMGQRKVSRFSEDVSDYRIAFEAMDESLYPLMASPDLYRDIMVCPFVPSWADPDQSIDNKWVRLDNETGVVEFDIQSLEPVFTRDIKFLLIGREKIDLFFRFIFACSGRLKPFWVAADDRGFELSSPAAQGDSLITISPIDYDFSLFGSAARAHIEMKTTSGTVIRRMISGIQTLPSGDEQLDLDSGLPVSLSASELNRCAWLELVRLDSDEIKLHWVGGDCLEVTLPIVVLP